MPQFPEYDARRVRRYSHIGGLLLTVVVVLVLHWLIDFWGLWQRMAVITVIAMTARILAEMGARWLVQQYPTTSATYY